MPEKRFRSSYGETVEYSDPKTGELVTKNHEEVERIVDQGTGQVRYVQRLCRSNNFFRCEMLQQRVAADTSNKQGHWASLDCQQDEDDYESLLRTAVPIAEFQAGSKAWLLCPGLEELKRHEGMPPYCRELVVKSALLAREDDKEFEAYVWADVLECVDAQTS